MNITFITTVQHNVGDDFVREGLKYILQSALAERELHFTNIHKHSPVSARYGFEWLRSNKLGLPVDRLLPLALSKDRLLEADLVVQSGAPVYWHHDQAGAHCADNEWYRPLIKRRFSRVSGKGVRLFNLAAGTCQQYDSDGSEFMTCSKCSAYIKQLFSQCEVTTVRDDLSRNVLAGYGLDAPVIPCSSIFAPESLGVPPKAGEYVALNYMHGGGHYAFQKDIDTRAFHEAFARLYAELTKRERVVLVCHDAKEERLARTIDANAAIFSAGHDYRRYVEFYANAKYGIVNRVHAAFILAGLGKPSLVIGNDSRARMSNKINLQSIFVGDATGDVLIEASLSLSRFSREYPDVMRQIKTVSLSQYVEAISPALVR
jgi:hypothetical protein